MKLKGCDCVDESCIEEAEMEVTVESDTIEEDKGKQIVFVNEISHLAMIQKDVVQLVVFRQSQDKVPTYASTLLLDHSIQASSLPSFEGVVTKETVNQTIQDVFYPRYKLRSRQFIIDDDIIKKGLIDDIDQLVHIFADISQSESVFVKLEVVKDNACAFWHQDCVEFRLVKTYLGPCTEWVPPAHSKATLRQRQYNTKYSQSFFPGDVALFKGRGDAADSDDEFFNHPGIVHRSPRIEEGSGIFRFVLVLDVPQEGWHY